MKKQLIAFVILAGFLVAGVAALDGTTTPFTYRPKAVKVTGWAYENAGVTERVKCIFKGSETAQKCYTDRADCSGLTACTTGLKGKKGEVIVWKSSCGGYGKSTIDGQDETVGFDCSLKVKELVQCFFKGGKVNAAQTCYSEYGKCSGVGNCKAEYEAPKGAEISWKSSCGGVQTITVGTNERKVANFDCGNVVVESTSAPHTIAIEAKASETVAAVPPAAVPPVQNREAPPVPAIPAQPVIPMQQQTRATWTCYGKQGLAFAGSASATLSEEEWKAVADQSCQGHCMENDCGVAKFKMYKVTFTSTAK